MNQKTFISRQDGYDRIGLLQNHRQATCYAKDSPLHSSCPMVMQKDKRETEGDEP